MRGFAWFLVVGVVGAFVYFFMRWREKWVNRQRASEVRFATFIAEVRPDAPAPALAPVSTPSADPKERLLLEAASKAGEAGEPVLCIQLYARLLSRYPQTQFATQARAAVEQQKKNLAKT
jgi:hypothetical protein